MNPTSAKQAKRLLEACRILDFDNRQSWRDNVLLNMEFYISHGYFDLPLSRKIMKYRASILQLFEERFLHILLIPLIFQIVDTLYSLTITDLNLLNSLHIH